MKTSKLINVRAYRSGDGLVRRYQELVRNVMIPYQYEVMLDRVEGVEKSHAIQNFINAGTRLKGEGPGDGFYGQVFQDSDVAKWLEAAAFSLCVTPDAELEARLDQVVDIIADAQDEDGYLNTYYTIKDKNKRWTNLLEGHELYCAGHMMEAAVAYYEATGKDKLLNVMHRNALHIYDHFVAQGHEGYPGHPEVELALMKMYRATGDRKCLELCQHFLDVRGVDPMFFQKEKDKRNWTVWGNNPVNHEYQQSHKPVREQDYATGHAVRAVYLYTAMADLASETEDEGLLSACHKLWESITRRRMYVTGAIGSTNIGEAFTVDYNLPNDTVYGETCASIGLVFFAGRMLEMEADSKYGDVMETAFYNTVLAGLQLDGKRYFYVNPLEVIPGVSGVAQTHMHDLPQRPGWYACACCPPNAARMISSLGKYAYGENDTTAYCHMFAAGDVRFNNGVVLRCETEYPYGFTVKYTIERGGRELAVRMPGWSETFEPTVNGQKAQYRIEKGYAYLPVQDGDTVVVTLDSNVHKVYADSQVAANTGCAALTRGPLVYCVEGADNEGDVLSLGLYEDGDAKAEAYDPALLCGVTPVTAEGWRIQQAQSLYTSKKPVREAVTLRAVPYYAWGNRGEGQMRVWLPEK